MLYIFAVFQFFCSHSENNVEVGSDGCLHLEVRESQYQLLPRLRFFTTYICTCNNTPCHDHALFCEKSCSCVKNKYRYPVKNHSSISKPTQSYGYCRYTFLRNHGPARSLSSRWRVLCTRLWARRWILFLSPPNPVWYKTGKHRRSWIHKTDRAIEAGACLLVMF